jgi:TolB-like protein/Tfp pilus assembly protein PilF
MAAPALDPDLIRARLAAVLASNNFASAQRHRRFLEFIVEQTLAGQQATIKESVIGSEVFAREPGYDPRADAIVRVEANKLRTRLAAYYAGPGRDDDVIIEIPKGSYVPRFIARAPVMHSAVTSRWSGHRRLAGALAILAVAGVVAAWIAQGRNGATGGSTETPSVAVLPFLNLSGDPDNQYFSDGLAEQLTDALAQVKGLRVASRTSAFALRGTASDAQEIGKRLGVAAFIEGSVRKSDNRVRITAQLVQAGDGYHLWSQTFERELRDVFAIQDEISNAIVRALRVNLSPIEHNRLTRRPTQSIEAFDLYLRGRYIVSGYPSPTLIGQAAALFEEALKKDPEFALAHVGLAYIKFGSWMSDGPGAGDLVESMVHAIRRALEIDPNLPEALAALGTIQARHEWKWAEAEQTFRRAIALNPRSADAHWRYAHSVLLPLRRFEEAIAENRYATSIDPSSLAYATGLPWILVYAGRSDEAIAEYQKVLAAWPGNPTIAAAMADAFAHAGRYSEAITAYEDVLSNVHLRPQILPQLALAYARGGRRGDAIRTSDQYRATGATSGSAELFLALALGRVDDARAAAGALIRNRSANVYYLALDPTFRPLRDDPAFAALLRQTGLPLD